MLFAVRRRFEGGRCPLASHLLHGAAGVVAPSGHRSGLAARVVALRREAQQALLYGSCSERGANPALTSTHLQIVELLQSRHSLDLSTLHFLH